MVPALPDDLHLESLDVGPAPLVRHFLQRLDLHGLFQRHLPVLPGRRPQLATASVLDILLTNLLLARQPLYALPHWAARRVPDCRGRALDHLHRADRASLLVALTRQAVAAFHLDLSEFHQDTTTVTFSGAYADQPPVPQADRPPRITFGYHKDHRPDLKQLLFSITLCDDGAVHRRTVSTAPCGGTSSTPFRGRSAPVHSAVAADPATAAFRPANPLSPRSTSCPTVTSS